MASKNDPTVASKTLAPNNLACGALSMPCSASYLVLPLKRIASPLSCTQHTGVATRCLTETCQLSVALTTEAPEYESLLDTNRVKAY